MAYDRERDPGGNFVHEVVYWVRLARVTSVGGIVAGMTVFGAVFHFSPEEVEQFVDEVTKIVGTLNN
jgi:hypothetical protein